MSERNVKLLAGLGPADPLIEAGPSYNPIAERGRLDRDDRRPCQPGGSRRRYTGAAHVDIGRIETVDVIWRVGTLDEAFDAAQHGTVTGLIASHVIEHVPDFVGFLQAAGILLAPLHGALLLAVPDKRFCFDIFRPPTRTGQVLAAHRACASRHRRPRCSTM